MTTQNVERSINEQTLINVVNALAEPPLFVAKDDLNPLTPNQRATNEAINTARMIVNSPNFEADPETTTMRALAILNQSAKELAKLNEKHGYLTAYIFCRRLTHQATYAGIVAKRDALRMEQQMLRSNVASEDTRRFIEADDWASEFVTVEEHASAEELLLPQEELTPAQRAEQSVEAADYVYTLLKRPMDTFCAILMQFEKELSIYLSTTGVDYTQKVYLHSYTSVAFTTGKDTTYEEALSFDEAERLLAQKAAKRVESRANDLAALAQAQTKALRAL